MPEPINQFAYVMAKGEGNKGASYKYTWRPDWRLPPGVSQPRVFLQVAFWLGLAAVPVWGIPYLRWVIWLAKWFAWDWNMTCLRVWGC
jgi:hypothetical protein